MIKFEITRKCSGDSGSSPFVKLALVKRMHDDRGEKGILNKDLFTEAPPGQHVQIDHSVTPVHASSKVPVSLKDRSAEELLQMEKLGVITEQMEPAEWSHLRKIVSAWTQKTRTK